MPKITCALLVDDDTTANFLNKRLFQKLDVAEKLLVALNGLEALQLLQANCPGPECPQLILLDINMPVMDGFEFLKAYEQLELAQRQSVVIIMLTTSLNPNDVEKVERAQITGLLNKPLTEAALRRILDEHFED
ncbi:response regulator [Adhaeribacter pallidiroseus]|uniref:Histidine kinase n=1 Tax=Adhaeribacter pallidiroseus TaxID=2072847 RepID=A0A369Q771_9BACT|nr:response regulator [Adhaeribacter pallidiroseus]RDC58769.1 Histidine kinase [Adhaeribacter pallidiroseus]